MRLALELKAVVWSKTGNQRYQSTSRQHSQIAMFYSEASSKEFQAGCVAQRATPYQT